MQARTHDKIPNALNSNTATNHNQKTYASARCCVSALKMPWLQSCHPVNATLFDCASGWTMASLKLPKKSRKCLGGIFPRPVSWQKSHPFSCRDGWFSKNLTTLDFIYSYSWNGAKSSCQAPFSFWRSYPATFGIPRFCGH